LSENPLIISAEFDTSIQESVFRLLWGFLSELEENLKSSIISLLVRETKNQLPEDGHAENEAADHGKE
jgi:hypothetical protein